MFDLCEGLYYLSQVLIHWVALYVRNVKNVFYFSFPTVQYYNAFICYATQIADNKRLMLFYE